MPVEPTARDWGLHVIHTGYVDVPPGSPYPPSPHRIGIHRAYAMSWQRGRTLHEYQLTYLSRGSGVFESEPTGPVRIEAGQVFFLFPGVWHRYRPHPKTGWCESYIGFGGWYAERLIQAFFSPKNPTLRVGENHDLFLMIHSIKEIMHAAAAGYQQILAGRTVEILARIRSLAESYRSQDRKRHAHLTLARRQLLERADRAPDFVKFSRALGMSYSNFRLRFKKETGLPPRQYQIEAQISRAKNLLSHTEQSVQELAAELGFSSVCYFSRLFKKKTGVSPVAWRAQRPGMLSADK